MILNIEDLYDKKLNIFKKIIISTEKKELKKLTISDFIFNKRKPIISGTGVYIFFKQKKAIYVGKCSSRSFIERIPSHFDIRSKSWFNTLLKRIENPNKLKKFNYKNILDKEAHKALDNYSILLINFKKPNKEKCRQVEKILNICLKPELNSLYKYQHYNLDDTKTLKENIEIARL